MSRTKTIMTALAAGLLLMPLPASAHDGENGRIVSSIIGGAIAAAYGYIPPYAYAPRYGSYGPPHGYPPPYGPSYAPPYAYVPPPQAQPYTPPQAQAQRDPPPPQAPQPDADIAFVQHSLNALTGAGLAEDGIGGPATKTALLAYLQHQLEANKR